MLLLTSLLLVGCQSSLNSSIQKEKAVFRQHAVTLRAAYKLAKPVAVSKIGADADIFNAITTKLNKDGTSREWIVSFGAPSKNKSVAMVVAGGRVTSVSPITTINPEENDDVTPVKSNWIDSSQVARAVPEAWSKVSQTTMHYYFDAKAENEEGDTWQVIAKTKFWNVDMYSGRVVNQGEQKEEIKIPLIK